MRLEDGGALSHFLDVFGVIDLVKQVQDRIGCESARDVSASRWIATRRLDRFLASAKAIVSKHFSAKKAQVSMFLFALLASECIRSMS